MAIGPETNALIDSYRLKIAQKQKNKSEIEQAKLGYDIKDSDGNTLARIENLDVVINRFDPAINGTETEVLRINGLINDQQNLIFDLYTGATEVGCTTYTQPMVSLIRDDVRGYAWSFSGDNPFVESNTIITNSNIGFGTYSGITQTGLGTFHGIKTGSGLGTDGITQCSGYATSVSTAESTITTLRTQRNAVLTSVQDLKEARAEYELQRYGYNRAIEQTNEEISEAEAVITALQGSNSQYYLE